MQQKGKKRGDPRVITHGAFLGRKSKLISKNDRTFPFAKCSRHESKKKQIAFANCKTRRSYTMHIEGRRIDEAIFLPLRN